MVPKGDASVERSRSMQSCAIRRSSRRAELISVISEATWCVSTRSASQTPKFAIAPIPKVPMTPERRASSDFLPLDPAFQKLFLRTSSVIPMPSSRTVRRRPSDV